MTTQINPVEFAGMPMRAQAERIAAVLVTLAGGESVEIPWSETACLAIKVAEWQVAKGLSRFNTSRSERGNMLITRKPAHQQGLF